MNFTDKNIIYLYDGSYQGFLSCIFNCFLKKEKPLNIVCADSCEPTFFEQIFIETDTQKSERVEKGLRLKGTYSALIMLRQGFDCCINQKEMLLLDFIILVFEKGRDVISMLSEKTVSALNKAIKALTNEAHHLKGFVRFSVYENALIAVIEPKNFVLPYLAPHFCDRYVNEHFFIYDKTHNAALVYGNSKAEIIKIDSFHEYNYDSEEKKYQRLWKTFYNTISIKERENPKLRISHMPKRFWGNITEMKEDIDNPLFLE
ncbi:MAG: DNA metabolism protein [Ruminococcaceae bacterium]|nr:DNA metabolism protein [Oscillospiraceae bacterium]